MASLVGAFGTAHILMSANGIESQADRVIEGMKEVGRRIRALSPDLIILVTTDHMFNFNCALQVPFIVGVADEYVPFGDMDTPTDPFPGQRRFAEGFVQFAATNGFELAKVEEVRPDHGVIVPLLFIDPAKRIPVVPFYINVLMEPVPSPQRSWELGEILGRYIRERCETPKRIVVLATGGLSHWVGYDNRGINEDFDRRFLSDLAVGRTETWISKTAEEIEREAGNGGLEVIHWLFMAAAASNPEFEIIYYEPVHQWFTGMGGVAAINPSQRG